MDQIEEIKSKVDIVELIREYVPLKKAGRNWKANCPFHGEKTPSFMVNPELQIFKCFGCGEGGDVFSFLQKIEGLTFGESLKILADKTGVKLTGYKPDKQEEEREKLIKMNNLARETYHFLLTEHKSGKTAFDYVLKRGVKAESVKKFYLGYAPDDWNFLTEYLVKRKGYTAMDLVKAGLLIEGKNYDRFRNRIMFPLNNGRGETVGFAGRVLPGADDRAGGKYVNSPETEIYHKSELLYGFDVTRSEIKTTGFAVVVEGELDAICTYQIGIKNVTAIKGSALTEKQVELLSRVTDRIVLALDADMAGNAAARRGIQIAEKRGLFVETVDWNLVSEVKDAADLATSDPDKLRQLIKNPISIYSFIIDTAVKKFGLSSDGKSRVIKDILPVLITIEDEVRRDEYLKEAAKKVEIEMDTLRKQAGKLASGKPEYEDRIGGNQEKSSRGEILEEYIVGLLLRYEKTELLRKALDYFENPFWKKVADKLVLGDKKWSIAERIGSLSEELRPRVQELLLVEDGEKMDFEKEWQKAIDELEEIRVRSQLKMVTGQKLLKLTERLSQLTKSV